MIQEKSRIVRSAKSTATMETRVLLSARGVALAWTRRTSMRVKVYYEGYYIIEAESLDDAMETSRDDAEVEFEEWRNTEADEWPC